MREDIDLDAVDEIANSFGVVLLWQTTNQTIRILFNLALESLKEHEIDRCVWTLKKAVETSEDGEGIAHAVFQLLVRTELFPEALEVLNEAIGKEFNDQAIEYNLAYCLYQTGNYDEAENNFAMLLSGGEVNQYSIKCLNMLSAIRNHHGRVLEAKALTQEAISFANRLGYLESIARDYWNLSVYCENLDLWDEAISAAKAGQLNDPMFEDWDERIQELENLSLEVDDEDELSNSRSYEEWFEAGSIWHGDIPNDFFYGPRYFLEGLYLNGATWSDLSTHTFSFLIDEDGLEESLARVESLSSQLHLHPTWPVYLETPDISIAMSLNGNYLLAWVGVGLEGLLVGVNIKTWDVFHADDADARFAVGAVLNWFLDCSLNILKHEMFISIPHKWSEIDRPWESDLTTWSTTSAFIQDIENIRRYADRTPPRAHRVRGHIRTLTERQPTDEARENAPAYIRRNMGPTDTFVRSYTKSGDLGTEKLLVHLNTKSSLADYLGTAPLLKQG
jgi:tetratricopeptide (TPR) repeat protein